MKVKWFRIQRKIDIGAVAILLFHIALTLINAWILSTQHIYCYTVLCQIVYIRQHVIPLVLTNTVEPV